MLLLCPVEQLLRSLKMLRPARMSGFGNWKVGNLQCRMSPMSRNYLKWGHFWGHPIYSTINYYNNSDV